MLPEWMRLVLIMTWGMKVEMKWISRRKGSKFKGRIYKTRRRSIHSSSISRSIRAKTSRLVRRLEKVGILQRQTKRKVLKKNPHKTKLILRIRHLPILETAQMDKAKHPSKRESRRRIPANTVIAMHLRKAIPSGN